MSVPMSTLVAAVPSDCDPLGQAVVGIGLSSSLNLVFSSSKMILEPVISSPSLVLV